MSLPSGAIAAQSAENDIEDPIIINGYRLPFGLGADSELDENGIAAFGADNVGDLLGALALETDTNGDGPVVLINGELSSGIDDVADLPTEAVRRIQILPREVAGQIGQRPGRRVLNVVIKDDHRQLTLLGKARLATAGDGRQIEGEANFLKLEKGNRRSLVIQVTKTDELLESDRPIFRDPSVRTFDPDGNIVAFPSIGGEIDPSLSALAGKPLAIVGLPLSDNPSLSDFAAIAGVPNSGDLGRYRSLMPEMVTFSANGNLTQKLGAHKLALSLRGEHQEFRSRIGGAELALLIPENSPFSPFSRDVSLLTVIGDPLQQRSAFTTLTGAAVLNGPVGKWRYSASAKWQERWYQTKADRPIDSSSLQSGILDGSINPFADLDTLASAPQLLDHTRGNAATGGVQITANGPLFKLPAGLARASLRAEWRAIRSRSRSTVAMFRNRSLNRDEFVGQATVQLPLITAGPVGSLGLEITGAIHRVPDGRGSADHGYALNWAPDDNLTFRAAVSHEQVVPAAASQSEPALRTENVRIYDFVRQETAYVRYISGGNPDLASEKRRTISLGATWRPFRTLDFSLTEDFVDVRSRDAFSALPPLNADVQLAFPDRFVRDADGVLIQVDARPVGLARVVRQEIRSGLVFSHTFGATDPNKNPRISDDDVTSLGKGWRTTGFLRHSWALKSKRQARPDLPVIDLLNGGAIGYGGGQPRHRLNFGGGVVHSGMGLSVDGSWVSSNKITAGSVTSPSELRFASRLLLDARAFVNLGTIWSQSPVAKGARVAIEVQNIFDSRQRVTDSSGSSPQAYQRYLLDPLGRTITFSLRKAI